MTFCTPGTVVFMGIGGEFVLTVEGFTENAMSHCLKLDVSDHQKIEKQVDYIRDDAGRVPAIFVDKRGIHRMGRRRLVGNHAEGL